MASSTCCCGCCSVRCGTQFIGITSIIFGILNLFGVVIYGIVLAGAPPEAPPSSYGHGHGRENTRGDLMRDYRTFLIISLVISALFALLEIVLSAMLLNGVQNYKASRCRHWLRYSVFKLVMTVIGSIAVAILVFLSFGWVNGILFVVLMTIAVLIEFYFHNVVHQCVKELEEGGGGHGSYGYTPGPNEVVVTSRII